MFSEVLYNVSVYISTTSSPIIFDFKLKVRLTKISTNPESLKGKSTVSWNDNNCYL